MQSSAENIDAVLRIVDVLSGSRTETPTPEPA